MVLPFEKLVRLTALLIGRLGLASFGCLTVRLVGWVFAHVSLEKIETYALRLREGLVLNRASVPCWRTGRKGE